MKDEFDFTYNGRKKIIVPKCKSDMQYKISFFIINNVKDIDGDYLYFDLIENNIAVLRMKFYRHSCILPVVTNGITFSDPLLNRLNNLSIESPQKNAKFTSMISLLYDK